MEVEAAEGQDRFVPCYPVRLSVPSPPLPAVEMHVENNMVCVRYKGEMVKVSRSYFSKLVSGRWQVSVLRHGFLRGSTASVANMVIGRRTRSELW